MFVPSCLGWLSRNARSLTNVSHRILLWNSNWQSVASVKSAAPYGLGIPDPPKRPLRSYIQFMKERLAILPKTETPTSQTNVIKTLADEWNKLNPQDKEKYRERFQADKATYQMASKQWHSQLNDDQRALVENRKKEMVASRKKRREKRLRRQRKRELERYGKPKRPQNAFSLMVMERFRNDDVQFKSTKMSDRLFSWVLFSKKSITDRKSAITYKEAISEAAGAWREMSDAEKKPYVDEASAAMQVFCRHMDVWRKKMIAGGHEDLLKKPKKVGKNRVVVKPKRSQKISKATTKPTSMKKVKKSRV